MSDITLFPGVYRVPVDCNAPRPDKRVKHDWRTLPVLAGTLFRVSAEYLDGGGVVLCISALYGWSHMTIRVEDEVVRHIVAVLEPVAIRSPSLLLRYMNWENAAMDILDDLVLRELVNMEDVRCSLAHVREGGRDV
jgi:hypothetical protein